MDWKAYWNSSTFLRDPDPCRQVGRTLRSMPYSDTELSDILNRILTLLRPDPDARLLDLACGNGMLTSRLSPHFRSITAVDFSTPLIETARAQFAASNVTYLVGDALSLESVAERYDRVMLFCSLQYFSPEQADTLLRRISLIGNDQVRILLGDVADGDRRWHFYRGLTGRCKYVSEQLRDKPTIGHWWKPIDLLYLTAKHGLNLSIQYQNRGGPNHYFRYDAVLTRQTTRPSSL